MKIHYDYLRAVLAAASKDTTRAYLTGVFVQFQPTKTVYVATDGHLLLKIEEFVKNEVGDGAWPSFILPKETIPQLSHLLPNPRNRKSYQEDLGYKVEVVIDGVKLNFTACTSDSAFQTMNTKGIDATYPDYNRVIPEKVEELKDGEEITFNWRFFIDAQNAFLIAANRKFAGLTLKSSGPYAPAKMEKTFDNGHLFTAVMMPMRT